MAETMTWQKGVPLVSDKDDAPCPRSAFAMTLLDDKTAAILGGDTQMSSLKDAWMMELLEI